MDFNVSARDHPGHLILFRKYVSRKAAGTGRAVLEGVGLDSETIEACFRSHPQTEEEAIQAGLVKWCGGRGNEPPTWQVLFAAMEYAQIAQQHVHDLKKESGLFEHVTEQQEAATGGTDKSPKSEEESIPPKDSDVGATDEWQFKVGELEDKVKGMEQWVANLFMDNVALKTKLEASREVERQQQEEITRLKGQLVQAQDTATQEQSLSRTRESQLEEKIKVLEEAKSDLEAEVEKLEKQLKVLPNDTEKLAKGPSSDQKAVARYKVEEEARKGSKGETSAVPDQVTGEPTAATRSSQPPTQAVAVSPVIVAAKSGQLFTMRKLLDGGAGTVEDRDEEGATALLWASFRGHLTVVRELVNVYKADLFQKNEYDKNAMHVAAQGGHIEVIKFLLPLFGERVHEKDYHSYTMLLWAAQCGHCQVARYLIDEVHMDPQDRDKFGCTALLRAADGGSVPLVRALLEDYGSSVDEVNENSWNALHVAAYFGHLELVKFLIPILGEKKFAVTHGGDTCLTLAIEQQMEDVVEYLIQEGGFGRQH